LVEEEHELGGVREKHFNISFQGKRICKEKKSNAKDSAGSRAIGTGVLNIRRTKQERKEPWSKMHNLGPAGGKGGVKRGQDIAQVAYGVRQEAWSKGKLQSSSLDQKKGKEQTHSELFVQEQTNAEERAASSASANPES